MASGFLILISFFTRIPIGKKIKYNEENFVEALTIYTFVGLVIGLILSLIYLLFNYKATFIRALLLCLAYIVVTGGIHLDGLADTADGIFSGRTGSKVFEIMSDSHIGAFGVIGLILVILSQFVLFSYLDIACVFMMPIVGRGSTIVACWNKKYAKNSEGMGRVFIENITTRVLLWNLLIVFVFSLIFPYRIEILAASFATLSLSYFISTLIEDKIGGMTGDTCGFITEVSQIIFMILVILL